VTSSQWTNEDNEYLDNDNANESQLSDASSDSNAHDLNESNNGDNLNEKIKNDHANYEENSGNLENGDIKTSRSEQDDFITVTDMLSHVISFATLSIKIVLRLVNK